MKHTLPSVIAAMVAAKNAHDAAAFVACFRPDAVVSDEKQAHKGAAAIRAWFEETSRKYRTQMQPTGYESSAEGGVLTAEVSGNFPGSPFPFHYQLTLMEGKIAALRITSD